jgi:hypothetical protein
VWALIIVLFSAPVGAIAYLIFGKDRNGHDLAGPAGPGSAQRHAGSAGGHAAAPR